MGHLSNIIISVTDAIMVGQLGYKELAASSLMISIISIPSFTLVGITTLISSLTAARRGENKELECASLMYNSGFSILIFCLFIVTLLLSCFPIIYHFGQDDEIIKLGRPFYYWLSASLVPLTIFLCIKQFYDGLEMTRIPMILSASSIIINLGLNYLLIYGSQFNQAYGLAGSGMASFIARSVICVIMVLHLILNKDLITFGIKKIQIKTTEIISFLKLALPSSWQYTSEIAAFSLLAILAGWYGPIHLASHQIAITIAAFTYVIFVGFGSASSIKISEAFGRNDYHEIRKLGFSSLQISIAMALITSILLIIFRTYVVQLFNTTPEVIELSSSLLILAAVFQFSDSLQALGLAMLRGLQDIRMPTLYTTIAYWLLGIPAGYLLAENFQMKTHGIWIGFIICLTCSAGLLLYRFRKLMHSSDNKLVR